MPIKIIPQNISMLQEAYQMRMEEYQVLRSAEKWQGAVLQAGFLLELALKIAICKNLDEPNLPRIFQFHDLELLLYCSGLRKTFRSNPNLHRNFTIVLSNWSLDLRYERRVITKTKSEEVHQALFDSTYGVLTFLSSIMR